MERNFKNIGRKRTSISSLRRRCMNLPRIAIFKTIKVIYLGHDRTWQSGGDPRWSWWSPYRVMECHYRTLQDFTLSPTCHTTLRPRLMIHSLNRYSSVFPSFIHMKYGVQVSFIITSYYLDIIAKQWNAAHCPAFIDDSLINSSIRINFLYEMNSRNKQS